MRYVLLVAGSREVVPDASQIDAAYHALHVLDPRLPWGGALRTRVDDLAGFEVIHGDAPGADRVVGAFFEERQVKVLKVPADWGHYGKGAGVIRSMSMVKECHGALVFYDGWSRGTAHTVDFLNRSGKPYVMLKIKRKDER